MRRTYIVKWYQFSPNKSNKHAYIQKFKAISLKEAKMFAQECFEHTFRAVHNDSMKYVKI